MRDLLSFKHFMVMDKRQLAAILDGLPTFTKPKLRLEQYITPGDIAATMAWTMYMRRELNSGWVLDLGCGTGRLAYAVSLLGGRALCVDIDLDALVISKALGLDVALCDAEMPCAKRGVKVVMNPPFGVWRRHADVEFLRGAADVGDVIYTIHKYATYDYIVGVAESLGYKYDLIDVAVINIPPIYRHHRKRSHKVEVAIFRLEATSRGPRGRR